jgi:ferredoxin
MAPSVFMLNQAGYVEVVELDTYPEDEVNDAIRYCPENCITWE